MRMKRRFFPIALIISLLGCFVATWLAGSALSAPCQQAIGNPPEDLEIERVEFHSESGSTIHGWFIRGTKGGGSVVLMHGVRANRLSMLGRARFLSRAGYSVLLFDFQAHGESIGRQITFGHLESRDAQAAVAFLRGQLPDEKIALIGTSMGGAAALLASPSLDSDAMVLEQVYPAIDRAIANRLKVRLGFWAGALTPLLTMQLGPRLGVEADLLRPVDRVGQIAAPKLFIAGSQDRATTLDESNQLLNAASEPKEFWVVDGAAHVDLHHAATQEYEDRVLAFFDKYLRGRR